MGAFLFTTIRNASISLKCFAIKIWKKKLLSRASIPANLDFTIRDLELL